MIFLAEAFTRPKVMYRLAKLGFTQSYTYFTWRNTKRELTDYFTELDAAPVRDFFRPNLWPNTPDILPEYLQFGGRPALHGAAGAGRHAGRELRHLRAGLRAHGARATRAGERGISRLREVSGAPLGSAIGPTACGTSSHGSTASAARIARYRAIAASRFHACDNEMLIAYSKTTADLTNAILVVANLDPHHTQSGWLELDLTRLGVDAGQPFQAHDLLSGSRFLWNGPRNFVLLDPGLTPVHILRVRHRVHSEREFDYFL